MPGLIPRRHSPEITVSFPRTHQESAIQEFIDAIMFGVIWKQSPRYGHLSDNDDDYNDDNSDASHQSSRYPRKARGRLLTISTAVFILSLAVRVGIIFILPQVSKQQCVHDMFLDG